MKKLIILIMSLMIGFGLIGCSNMNNQDSSNSSNKNDEINFVEMDYYEIEYDKIEFPIDLSDIDFDETPIHTKEQAKNVGQMILKEWHKKGKATDKELISILHSKQDNMWRFFYQAPHEPVSTISNNVVILASYDAIYVAIDGNSGKLIKAWAVEG